MTDPTARSPDDPLAPRFRPLMRFEAVVAGELALPRRPEGAKLSICYFEGGSFAGERLRGRLLPGGGDWAVYDSEDRLNIEVRGVLKTDDEALIYLRYDGLWWAEPGLLPRIVQPGGHEHFRPEQNYLRVVARFETADERYAWLNRVLALGIGERTPAGVSYAFHEIL